MPPRQISSREFNQDTAGAKRAAEQGPVFITDRGEPSHVLLGIEEYRRLTGGGRKNIAELLWSPGAEDIELEIPPRAEWTMRPVDLD
jgi:prevent-host-death family protein